MRLPLLNEPVEVSCMRCQRAPREGETYGPHPEGWDFTGICPECWDAMFSEEDVAPEVFDA